MIIELEMLQAKLCSLPEFPDELKIMIEHMIISHHGEYEFGSPKLPMFPEALMLHYLDDLDSKMEAMRAQFERDATLDGPWTTYNPSLGRPVLSPEKFLRPRKVVEPEDAVITVTAVEPEPESTALEPEETVQTSLPGLNPTR